MIGGEARFDVRNIQRNFDVSPAHRQWVDIQKRDKAAGLFAQQERGLSRRWKLHLGVRLDVSAYRPDLFSPRAALIFQPSPNTAYKFLYGRGFRNPTTYELFYGDGSINVPNPSALPESGDTLELVAEHRVGKRINLVASAYGYRLDHLFRAEYTVHWARSTCRS